MGTCSGTYDIFTFYSPPSRERGCTSPWHLCDRKWRFPTSCQTLLCSMLLWQVSYCRKQNIFRYFLLTMPSSGTTCAVVGCTRNSRRLKEYMDGDCYDHRGVNRRMCGCPVPYGLHAMPKTKSRQWLAALKLKRPPKRVHVCSYHFIDKKPTELHPIPELFLGYNRPPSPKKRRVLVRRSVDNTNIAPSASAATLVDNDMQHNDKENRK